ncbi:hypothetical protein [Spiroplasma gladiatoris]|nr:hypothetical protein [Spiroplasma gladiatoris]
MKDLERNNLKNFEEVLPIKKLKNLDENYNQKNLTITIISF